MRWKAGTLTRGLKHKPYGFIYIYLYLSSCLILLFRIYRVHCMWFTPLPICHHNPWPNGCLLIINYYSMYYYYLMAYGGIVSECHTSGCDVQVWFGPKFNYWYLLGKSTFSAFGCYWIPRGPPLYLLSNMNQTNQQLIRDVLCFS